MFVTPIQKQATQYLDVYCTTIRNFTIQTMRSKRYIILRFIDEVGTNNAQRITNQHFDEWRINMLNKGISPRTVNARTAHAIAFLKYLQQMGHSLKINFTLIRNVQADPIERTSFSPEQIRKALDHCVTEREKLFIALAFESGLRLSELASLTVESIKGDAIRIMGKGRKIRIVYITDVTAQALDKWIARNGIEAGFVFPSPMVSNACLSADQVRLVMKLVFKRAGISGFHPHTLRYSFATTLADNGADLITIQRLLGHSNLATTSRYLQRLDNRLKSDHKLFMTYNAS